MKQRHIKQFRRSEVLENTLEATLANAHLPANPETVAIAQQVAFKRFIAI